MELEEQVLISGTVIGVGVETEQRKKFVTRTIVYKDNKEKMEVSKEKSDEFTLSIGGIVSLFEFLDIEFLSASVMLGKSTANTYYFDFSGPNKTKQDLAFNQLVYTHKKYPELDEIPHGTTTSKYYEKAFSLGLLATFGGKTRGEWIIKSDPEGGEKRTFNYDTQFTTSNLFSGNNNKFRVHGVLEFEGNDFNNPSKRSVTAHYEVKDDVSSYKELKHRLFKVNEMVGDKNFVTYTPELYTVNHQGPTYMNLNLTLRENAFECIFEKKNCAAKGPRAHKVDRELEKVRKKEGAVKEFIKFGNFLKESLVLEDKFSNLRKFIGEEKFDAEFWLKGEFVSDEGFVHVNRPAKIQ
jgi:hypothetical protein